MVASLASFNTPNSFKEVLSWTVNSYIAYPVRRKKKVCYSHKKLLNDYLQPFQYTGYYILIICLPNILPVISQTS
jgi:hypothetical protein